MLSVCKAPGKLILTGEHSVVYGEPALLAAVGLWTKTLVKRVGGSIINLSSKQLKGNQSLDIESVLVFWQKAKEAWEAWQSGVSSNLHSIRKDQLVVLKVTAGEFLNKFAKEDLGFEIEVDSEIPVGSGLGSSASVAASVIGGLCRAFEVELGSEDLSNTVFEVEKIMHGNPSGGDNTAVVYGGFLKFEKRDSKFSFRQIEIKASEAYKIILVDSGKPVESTGEMVEKVGENFKQRRAKYKKTINSMGRVAKDFIKDFKKGVFNKDLISQNQKLLDELGAVGGRAREMVQLIEELGGAAKICGAGGIRKGSGILLCYHEDGDKLKNFINQQKWSYYSVDLGVEGVKWRQ